MSKFPPITKRELDAIVAELVFGYKNVITSCPKCGGTVTEGAFTPAYGCFDCGWYVPYSEKPIIAKPYSTKITAACEIVSKLFELGWEIITHGTNNTGLGFQVTLIHCPSGGFFGLHEDEDICRYHNKPQKIVKHASKGNGNDFCFALCLAAIEAISGKPLVRIEGK